MSEELCINSRTLKFNMKSIKAKIIIILSIIVIFTAVSINLLMTAADYKAKGKIVRDIEELLNEQHNEKLKEHVDIAITMLDTINNKVVKGEITIEEGKKQGAELLRTLKYDNTNYFWADSTEGTNIVCLGLKVEGTNRINDKDKSGKFHIKEIIDNGLKENGGFTDYYMPRAGDTEAVAKRAYSRFYKLFGWIIGTGIYIDDISTRISEVNKVIQEIAQVAQKSSEDAELIRNNVSDTVVSVEQIEIRAQKQAVKAQDLNEIIEKFNI